MSDREFLEWVRDRLVHVYGESPNVDFVQRLGKIAGQAQASKPIAAVHGWFHGECVIRALDPEAALPAGMALYSQPQAQAGEPVAVADKGVINWLDGKQFDHEADLYTQSAVNQQLLGDIINMMIAVKGAIKLGRGADAYNYIDAAIAAAQEQSQ